jgi:hypothetical protein
MMIIYTVFRVFYIVWIVVILAYKHIPPEPINISRKVVKITPRLS